jgi:PAS domain S-box-containing protein
MLEDNGRDAELILATLEGEGIIPEAVRVETRDDFVRALGTPEFDLILSDFSLPSFDGLSALQIAKIVAPDIPFIFVSGTIGEEGAIESVKGGATDYVLKHRLSRLGSAVRRAMAENESRRAREQAERDRQKAESLFRALFDQMALGVLITDLDGQIVRANAAMEAMLGYSRPDIERCPIGRLISAERIAVLKEQYNELLSGRRSRCEFEELYLHRDGISISGRTVLSLILENGLPTLFVHLIEDITERKELDRRFIEAQKMEIVGRMSAGFTHDFNNLLTVIVGHSEMLLDCDKPGEEFLPNLHAIHGAGQQAILLAQRLLSLGRRQSAERVLLDLNEVITNLDLMVRKLAGAQISVITSLDPDLAPIEAGRGHLEQIMLNLVINARDAMIGGGSLRISTRQVDVSEGLAQSLHLSPGPHALLTVTDSGHGMDETTKSHIFRPFFTTKEIGKGTGLGLWMVHEIIRQDGGAISVDSVVGQGTSFHICFPQVIDQPQSSRAGRREDSQSQEPGVDAPGTKLSLRAPAGLRCK